MLFAIFCTLEKNPHPHNTGIFGIKKFQKVFPPTHAFEIFYFKCAIKIGQSCTFFVKNCLLCFDIQKNHWTKYVRFHLYCIHFFMLYDFTEFRRI